MIARFAVVWSVRLGFRLRASAIASDEHDSDEYGAGVRELEILAKLRREKELKEISEGLGIFGGTKFKACKTQMVATKQCLLSLLRKAKAAEIPRATKNVKSFGSSNALTKR